MSSNRQLNSSLPHQNLQHPQASTDAGRLVG